MHIPALEESDQQHPCDKAPDMGPPRHAPALNAARGAAEQLEQEPKSERDNRRNIDQARKKSERDEHQDPGARVEQEVGPQHA